MSQRPISRSADLKRLRDEGFSVLIKAGFLVVSNVPYVTAARHVCRGSLVCKLDLSNDVASKPEDHTTFFAGEYPCHADGSRISKIENSTETKVLAEGLTVHHRFSAKPKPSDAYADFYEKVTTYVAILQGPAQQLQPGVKANEFVPVSAGDEDNSVFHYIDTASSRAEIDLITDKLKRIPKVAIVGLGGTGGYILDLLAKTPVREIHLIDGDKFLQHNAFRAPGAPPLEVLDAHPLKVQYLADIYGRMRRGIVAHPEYLTEDNLFLLEGSSFVFVCVDDGKAKRAIVEWLEAHGVPFIDVGMGIYEGDGALGGALRVTASTPENRAAARSNNRSSAIAC